MAGPLLTSLPKGDIKGASRAAMPGQRNVTARFHGVIAEHVRWRRVGVLEDAYGGVVPAVQEI